MGHDPRPSILSWLGNLPMKRFLFRISALAMMLVLGLVAIVYAQRSNGDGESNSDPRTPRLFLGADAQPNPLRTADARPMPKTVQSTAVRQASHDATTATEKTPMVAAASPSSPPALPADPFGLQTSPPPGSQVRVNGVESAPRTIPAEPGTLALGGPERPLNATQASPQLAGPATVPTRSPAPLSENPAIAAPPALVGDRAISAPPRFNLDNNNGGSASATNTAPAAPPLVGDRAIPIGASATAEGVGRPASNQQLDGPQTPQLTIQKFAPQEIQVGKPAVFRIEVKNVGPVAAVGVEIRDDVPKGTRLVETNPHAATGARGELVWTLGKIEPGATASVEANLMPLAEGEIGSVATVSFSASASVRTKATRPQLVVEAAAPKQVMIDGEMTLTITVSNPGTGVASGVVVEEHVPSGMQHPAGAELEYEVGELRPGQSQTLELKLTAVRAGAMSNVLIARADGVEQVKQETPVQVVAPELKLAMAGPANRYLERQATYELSVSNPGTAPAKDVRLAAQLPTGLKFVSANNNAHYDEQTRTVHWALAELPVNETGTVQLITLPVEIGQQTVCFRGTADRALTVKHEQPILIDGIAAIRFQVIDAQDPIEVGGETTYEIRVLNQGSKDATNVRLIASLSPGLQPIAAEGPGSLRSSVQGNQIQFDPLARLSPKVDTTYRVRVRGIAAGDHRIRVQLKTDEMQSPVTKEESTSVFSDK